VAFPTIVGRTSGASASAVTSTPVTLPAHEAGDFLYVIFSIGVAETLVAPAGWTRLQVGVSAAAPMGAMGIGRIATSSAETVTVTTSASAWAQYIAYAFRGHSLTSLPGALRYSPATANGVYPALTVTPYTEYAALAYGVGPDPTTVGGAPTTPTTPGPWSNYVTQVGVLDPLQRAIWSTQSPQKPAGTNINPGADPNIANAIGWTLAVPNRGVFPFSGTVAIASAASGVLTSVAPPPQLLSGTVALTSAVVGDITISTGPVSMAGVSAVTSGATGTLSTVVGMAGAVGIVSSVAGAVSGRLAVAGVVAIHSAVEGDIIRQTTMAGAVTIVSRASGNITAVRMVSGTVPIVSALAGAITTRLAVQGVVAIVSAVYGEITIRVRPGAGGFPDPPLFLYPDAPVLQLTGNAPVLHLVGSTEILDLEALP